MDTGKSELKILTDTIVAVLERHTKAIESGLKETELLHSSVIKKLLEKIDDFKPAPLPIKPTPLQGSVNKPEVLHGAPKDLSPTQEPKPVISPVEEGPKERNPLSYQATPTEDITPENIDNFSDLMSEDSLVEPKVERLKK